jgi:hypothetical protein
VGKVKKLLKSVFGSPTKKELIAEKFLFLKCSFSLMPQQTPNKMSKKIELIKPDGRALHMKRPPIGRMS